MAKIRFSGWMRDMDKAFYLSNAIHLCTDVEKRLVWLFNGLITEFIPFKSEIKRYCSCVGKLNKILNELDELKKEFALLQAE